MRKKLISFFISFLMMFNLVTPFGMIYAEGSDTSTDTATKYVVFDVEKFSLGRGYVQEPILVPIDEGDNCAQILKKVLTEEKIKYTGTFTSGFYLSRLYDGDDTILEGYTRGRSEEGWLGEFDYNSASGWMFTLNNQFPNVGMSSKKVSENDVMRVQFTVKGYGTLPTSTNKDKLITALAKINSSDEKEKILSYQMMRQAYKEANDVVKNLDSTQTQVDEALTTLNAALESQEYDEKAVPMTGLRVQSTAEVEEVEELQLKATVVPENTTDDKTVTWTTSDSSVATVDKNGLVTGKSIGSCKIYAWAGDYRAVVNLNVVKNTSVEEFIIKNNVLVKYNGESTDIVIPEGVTSIADDAFKNSTVTSIKFPESMTVISEGLFQNNSDLTSVTLSDKTTTIEASAFSRCTKLTSITIPSSVTEIGDSAFSYTGLKGIEIPANVKSIGKFAFSYSKLENAKILSDTTKIEQETFRSCSNLLNVTISPSITTIGKGAFKDCSKLQSIKIDGKTYDKEKVYDLSNIDTLEIQSASNESFYNNKAVEYVIFSDKIQNIPKYAFYNCTSLKEISLPSSVTKIGQYAFQNCTAVESISLPDSVELIDSYAFSKIPNIESIKLPSSLKQIGNKAFENWTALKTITIPKSVTTINTAMLDGATALTEILVEEGSTSFKSAGGVLYDTNGKLLIIPLGLQGETLEIADGTTEINSSLNGAKNLKKVVIPASVTKIGTTVFNGCANLEEIVVAENNANYMSDNGVLYTRSKSQLIVYPSAKKGTEYSILEGCTSIVNNAFGTNLELTTLNMPASLQVLNYNAISKATNLVNVNMSDDATKVADSAFSNCKQLKNIKISSKTESIGVNAFYQCANLKEIELPSTLKSIGNNAFFNCSSITQITIPESVTTMGIKVFYGMSKLTDVKLPSNLTKIGEYTFNQCSKLTSIEIPESVTAIDRYAFAGTGLASISIPESVKTLGVYAFNNARSLKEVYIYNKDMTIPNNAFNSTSTSLTIYGYKGSTAETFATNSKKNFVALEGLLKVTFDPVNGSDKVEKAAVKDTAFDYQPEAPSKDGYVFVGWFKDVDDVTTEYKTGEKYTENVTYTAKYAHVSMLGAQAKTVVNDKSGIRFGTRIYNDGDKILEMGTLILPLNLVLEGSGLTLETPKVAKSVAKVLYEENYKENYKTYLGTLVNIESSQFDREITASSYVKYKDKKGNEYVVYAPYKTGSTSVNKLLAESK